MQKTVEGGFVEIVDTMGDELTIVNAARASFGKRKDLLEKSDIGLLNYLWKNRHTSPFEKVTVLLYVECSLPVAKQWMRHRTWSYNEISRRYTSENIEVYIPRQFRLQDTANKQNSQGTVDPATNESLRFHFGKSSRQAISVYEDALHVGVAREQARFILPQGLMTSFYAKVDLKNLMDFLVLRMAPDAQYEIQVFATAIREMLIEKFPVCMDLLAKGKWVWQEQNG
jgi:thymidylate synthase (FAD)